MAFLGIESASGELSQVNTKAPPLGGGGGFSVAPPLMQPPVLGAPALAAPALLPELLVQLQGHAVGVSVPPVLCSLAPPLSTCCGGVGEVQGSRR